jgi:diguanylate cyclase (GGDEF)-like protein
MAEVPGVDFSRLRSPALARLVACAVGGSLASWQFGWLTPDGSALLAALLATSAAWSVAAAGRGKPSLSRLAPSFVVDVVALVLLGPIAAVASAAIGAYARWRAGVDHHGDDDHRGLVAAVAAVAAMQFASLAFHASNVWLAAGSWPLRSVPIALAVTSYVAVAVLAFELAIPWLTKRPRRRDWASRAMRWWGDHLLAASAGAIIAELLARQSWGLLGVALVPLAILQARYHEHASGDDDDPRSDDVVDALGHGRASIGPDGRIRTWTDRAARITECPPERAIGVSLTSAIPALTHTRLPQAVVDAMSKRSGRQGGEAVPSVILPTSTGPRIVDVTVFPETSSVTLVIADVTDRVLAEQQARRIEERMALVAEGAGDGLWEWDLRVQTLYLSGPWNATLGLPATSTTGPVEMWFGRVHSDDLGPLKERLEAHMAGQTGHFTHEHRMLHEDGTYRRITCRGVAVRGAGRRAIRLGGSMSDTPGLVRASEVPGAVHVQRDPLTGLANRTVFVESLGRRLTELKARRGAPFAALYLDLDRFKVVNDSLGHMVGDELLTAVSRRLEGCLRDGDELARLGGDEFAILLHGLGDGGQANAIAFRIQESLNAPFSIGGREVFTSASIGIAFSRQEYDNPEEMMRDADTAMYHAKAHGKARHELFDADMHARTQDRLGFENDLRRAVKANAFDVNYQPIVSLANGRCIGFEALVRWQRDGQAVSPATFVPVAEELGIIEALGTFVLQEACQRFADWQRRFPEALLEYITVNVSTRQLMQQGFLHVVEQAVVAAGLRPSDLRLEITETTLMDNPAVAAEALRELRNFGVKIYLDDFGTGYSSLSHLHKLPVDALKIDRSFVRSLLLPDRPAIVESILALARTLETGVVAEGVESEVQATELERLGCRHAQGYLFSRPLSEQAVEQMLLAGVPLGDLAARFSPGAGAGDPSRSITWRFDDDPAATGRVAEPMDAERTSGGEPMPPALAGAGSSRS